MFRLLPQLAAGSPVNKADPLAAGLLSFWAVAPAGHPGFYGGPKLWDLCRKDNGVLTGGALWSGNVHRGGYGGITFDGTDDYVALTTGGYDYTGDKSFFAWVYLTSLATNRPIFARDEKDVDGLNVGYTFRTAITTGKLVYTKRAVADVNAVTTAVAASTWQFVGFAKNSTGVTFYSNGVGETISDSNAEQGGQSCPVRIGSSRRDDIFFIGQIDNALFYNRTLTGGEAWQLYQDSLQGHPRLLNRVSRAAWFVKAGTGTTVTPSTASLTITTFAPTVTATANKTVTPTTLALTTATFAPTVTANQGNQVCRPDSFPLVLTLYAPDVTGEVIVSSPGTQPEAGAIRIKPRKDIKEKKEKPQTVRAHGWVSMPGPDIRGNAFVTPETIGVRSQFRLPPVTITGKVRIAPPQGMQEIFLALGEYDLALAMEDEQ